MPKQRFILSGGPGTGKTSLLLALKERGFRCFEEISRKIITQELENESDILPWKDLHRFSEKVIRERIQQYHDAEDGLNIYDRSIIDSLAYMEKDKLSIPEAWRRMTGEFLYESLVFVTPPWPEIYRIDSERRESPEDLMEIHEALVNLYQRSGYTVDIIPRMSVQERADYIETKIQSF